MDFVEFLLKEYEFYFDDIKDVVEFVIVDDCLFLEYEVKDYDLNFMWLRIIIDIQWNQVGFCNFGVIYVKFDKIIIIDLDCLLFEDILCYLVNVCNSGCLLYCIYCIDEKIGKVYCGYLNLFFMFRVCFFRFYGYDEEFVGYYGLEDYCFVKFYKDYGFILCYLFK